MQAMNRKKKTFTFLFLGLFFMTVLAACSDSNNTVTNHNGGGGTAPAAGFVLTSDSGVGNLTTLTTTLPRKTEEAVLGALGLHSDSVITSFDGLLYIIQRLGSNSIVVIDPNDPSVVLNNYTANDGGSTTQSNPHDMAFVSASKAYISRYSLNTLLIVNPETGAQLGTIDLSAFADSDGIVEMDQMVLVDGLLYVSLQRLNRDKGFSAENPSFVVVIDTNTDQVINPSSSDNKIVLSGRNPFDMKYLASTDRIVVANVGNFFTGDDFGGIEILNPNTGLSEGLLMTDNDFGGPLGTIAIRDEMRAYVTVFDASFNNFVVPFDLSTQEIGTALSDIGTGFIPSLAFDDAGFFYVADRDTTNPGIQVFDTTTNQKVEGPINTGLPPNAILFVTP